MIKLETITKSFGEKKVLQNLSLEVKTNEILTLLGPNGCGKTTLLNLISGLTKPDEGNIYIDGILVNGKNGAKKVCLNPCKRKVGYVFQAISLFPHMRVQDNIAYGLKAMNLPKKEVKKRTENLLDFVGLNEYAKHYPHQLSGGQKQRTALARSLATKPQLLLLDEPVSALDPQLRESFRLELKKYLQKLKITVIYVTHNLSEAFIMSDRIAVMGNGCIQQIGTGAELFDKTRSTYVAKFLGINTFRGKAVKTRGRFLEIEVSGLELLATSQPELVGKEVVCTIKPENIALLKAVNLPTNGNAENSVEGIITEMVQMRSNAQITVNIGFTIRTRVPLSVIKASGLTIGDRVYTNFAADALNIFADDQTVQRTQNPEQGG